MEAMTIVSTITDDQELMAAAANFAAIVDADVKESTTTYTYQNDAVGTLVYTKTNDGTSLAKVDVSIKQIPHLQQIIYKTPEQVGTNGTDYYAARPLASFNDYLGPNRTVRTVKDSKAAKASNYLYKYDTWFDEKYPTSMWNEPILMASFDAVPDNGIGGSKTMKAF